MASDHDDTETGATTPASAPPAVDGAPRQAGQSGPPRGQQKRGGPGGRAQPAAEREHREERRRRKESGERRAYAGFGDTMERAFCEEMVHGIPQTFPVVHRQGVATLRVVAVAHRPDAVLYCDSGHVGPHRWPDGDEVGAPPIIAAADQEVPEEAVAEPGDQPIAAEAADHPPAEKADQPDES